MNIIVLSSPLSCLTGGNVYESSLYRSIINNTSHEVEFCEEMVYPNGINFLKIICPFLELRLLKKIKKNKICFGNSTLAYRHFLLFLIVRIFYPNKKLFIIHHHYQFEVLTGFKRVLFGFFELNFLRLSSSIIIPSPYVLYRTQQLLPKKKIDFIEIAFKEDQNVTKNIEVNNGELLFIGTIEYRKGLHLLLDSLYLLKKHNKNFKINIIGSVVDKNYYLKLLEKVYTYGLENSVKFHGRVSSEILHDYLLHSDLFVFPSLLEGYGMVIIEAMSYGIPVVAFNNSAMPFSIKNGVNGFLANNEDVLDFSNLVAKVICNPTLRHQLSQGAFDTYNKSRRDDDFIRDVENFVATF